MPLASLCVIHHFSLRIGRVRATQLHKRKKIDLHCLFCKTFVVITCSSENCQCIHECLCRLKTQIRRPHRSANGRRTSSKTSKFRGLRSGSKLRDCLRMVDLTFLIIFWRRGCSWVTSAYAHGSGRSRRSQLINSRDCLLFAKKYTAVGLARGRIIRKQ